LAEEVDDGVGGCVMSYDSRQPTIRPSPSTTYIQRYCIHGKLGA